MYFCVSIDNGILGEGATLEKSFEDAKSNWRNSVMSGDKLSGDIVFIRGEQVKVKLEPAKLVEIKQVPKSPKKSS